MLDLHPCRRKDRYAVVPFISKDEYQISIPTRFPFYSFTVSIVSLRLYHHVYWTDDWYKHCRHNWHRFFVYWPCNHYEIWHNHKHSNHAKRATHEVRQSFDIHISFAQQSLCYSPLWGWDISLRAFPIQTEQLLFINTGVSIYMILKHKTEHFLLRNFKPFNLQRSDFFNCPAINDKNGWLVSFVLTLA